MLLFGRLFRHLAYLFLHCLWPSPLSFLHNRCIASRLGDHIFASPYTTSATWITSLPSIASSLTYSSTVPSGRCWSSRACRARSSSRLLIRSLFDRYGLSISPFMHPCRITYRANAQYHVFLTHPPTHSFVSRPSLPQRPVLLSLRSTSFLASPRRCFIHPSPFSAAPFPRQSPFSADALPF
jgi:hypothetical protein